MSSPSILRVNTLRVSAAVKGILTKIVSVISNIRMDVTVVGELFMEIEDTDPNHVADYPWIYIASFFLEFVEHRVKHDSALTMHRRVAKLNA